MQPTFCGILLKASIKTAVISSGRLDTMLPRVKTTKPCSAETHGSISCTQPNTGSLTIHYVVKPFVTVFFRHRCTQPGPHCLTSGRGLFTSQFIPPTSTTLGINGRGYSIEKSILYRKRPLAHCPREST